MLTKALDQLHAEVDELLREMNAAKVRSLIRRAKSNQRIYTPGCMHHEFYTWLIARLEKHVDYIESSSNPTHPS